VWTFLAQWPVSSGQWPVSNGEPGPAQVPGAVEFTRSRLGFEPDGRQEALLRSGVSRGIVNCSRQWGKPTVGGGDGGSSGLLSGQESGGGGLPYGETERIS
jgi:hypothetical protein